METRAQPLLLRKSVRWVSRTGVSAKVSKRVTIPVAYICPPSSRYSVITMEIPRKSQTQDSRPVISKEYNISFECR